MPALKILFMSFVNIGNLLMPKIQLQGYLVMIIRRASLIIPGIIFMTDSTFLENPKATMRYGKFVLKGKVIDALFDDGKKATYTIQDLQ